MTALAWWLSLVLVFVIGRYGKVEETKGVNK